MQTQPICFVYLEKQNPQGNPFSITPLQLAAPKSSREPTAEGASLAPESFSGVALPRARVPALSPRLSLAASLGRVFFHWVFVSFENTQCLCCSFSAAQCASPFPRPGARASVRSRQSQVAGVAGHPRASRTDKVSSAANVSRGNGTLKAHPLETIYKALRPL